MTVRGYDVSEVWSLTLVALSVPQMRLAPHTDTPLVEDLALMLGNFASL